MGTPFFDRGNFASRRFLLFRRAHRGSSAGVSHQLTGPPRYTAHRAPCTAPGPVNRYAIVVRRPGQRSSPVSRGLNQRTARGRSGETPIGILGGGPIALDLPSTCPMGDHEYRVITDPCEGRKRFTLQTRVTSRGETAVILMGVDSAERVMCHASTGLDLPEDVFVFNVGTSTSGILDQLLAQGALKVSRVVDVDGADGTHSSMPICELTPGGAAQPPFEGAGATAAAAAHRALETAAADASEENFFNALRNESSLADARLGNGASPAPASGNGGARAPANATPTRAGKGAPPGMPPPPPPPPPATSSPRNAGADILAMLNGGGSGSPFPPPPPAGMLSPLGGANTPPAGVSRQMMPRTTRGSTGGGALRVRGAGGGAHDDGFFDASAGANAGGAPSTVGSVSGPGPRDAPPPGLSPLGNLGGLSGLGGLFTSPAGGVASPFASSPFAQPPASRDAGADILGMLAGGKTPPSNTSPFAKQGTPSNEDLLAMLSGSGGGGGASPKPPPPGMGAPMSAADFEAEAMASVTKREDERTKQETESHGVLTDMGALGLGFDDDDFTLPPRVGTPQSIETKEELEELTADEKTEPDETDEAPKDKEAARVAKREKKKQEKEEKKHEERDDVLGAIANVIEDDAAAKESPAEPEPETEKKEEEEKPPVTSYSSDFFLSLRSVCRTAPPEIDLEMFHDADKTNPDNLNAKAKAEKIREHKLRREEAAAPEVTEEKEEEKKSEEKNAAAEPAPVSEKKTPSRSRSDDRLDEPGLGGALGLGFLNISSASLAGMDETETTKSEAKTSAETSAEKEKKETQNAPASATKPPPPMTVSELAKALLAELRGLEDRVEVVGDEMGPMAMLKLGTALEAIRDEPFRSI